MAQTKQPNLRTYELYKDEQGEWRWRLLASNGNLIRENGEGLKNRSAALSGIYDDAKGETNYCIVEIKADGSQEPILPMH